MPDESLPLPHSAEPDIFREALAYSEAEAGFTAALIEKDYFCSLVLRHFFSSDTALVFRGGTCLSKVHVGFYRLSEDLDFVFPAAGDLTRSQRRDLASPLKRKFQDLPDVIHGSLLLGDFEGHNECRQYIGYMGYASAVIEKQERIKIEVSLREELLVPPVKGRVQTIAVNPFTGFPLVAEFPVRAMAVKEAYAEKLRAAMTRREPAIRDFFDVFHAVEKKLFDPCDLDLLRMVRSKLQVRGNPPVALSAERKQDLARQMEGQLRPVLRPRDLAGFDLDEAFHLVCDVAEACGFPCQTK